MNPFSNRKKIDELVETLKRINEDNDNNAGRLLSVSKENQNFLREMASRIDALGTNLLQRIKDASGLIQRLDANDSEAHTTIITELKDLDGSISAVKLECSEWFRKLYDDLAAVTGRIDNSDALLKKIKGDIVNHFDESMNELNATFKSQAVADREILDAMSNRLDGSEEVLQKVQEQMQSQYDLRSSFLSNALESQNISIRKDLDAFGRSMSSEISALSKRIDSSEERMKETQNTLLNHVDSSLRTLTESFVSESARKEKVVSKELEEERSFLQEKLDGISAQLTKLEDIVGLDAKGSRLRTVFYRQARGDRKLDELLVREERSAYDLMLLLKRLHPFEVADSVEVETAFPVAENSDDHRFPHGTANDNTRSDRFLAICEAMYPHDLSFMDLGCSGGGLVLDFALAGHDAVGIEGSDFSQKTKRAAWRVLDHSLFTADVSKPFYVKSKKGNAKKEFKLITAWEVLEHIELDGLVQLLANVKEHLAKDGLFVGSVNTLPDFDEKTGAIYHKTVQPKEWWIRFFKDNGLNFTTDHKFTPYDFPRGVRGGLYDSCDYIENPESGFHFVAKCTV